MRAAFALVLAAELSMSGIAWAADQSASVVTAVGTLEPRETADVYAPASRGRVKSLGIESQDPKKTIDFGSHVKKNDILLQLDSTTEAAHFEQAKAELRAAEAKVELAKSQLVLAEVESRRANTDDAKKNPETDVQKNLGINVARAKLRIAEATVDAAKASLQLAKARLDQCTVVSPIDGVVISCRVNIGQSVPRDIALFLIASDLDKLQVWASVDEKDINRVAVGQPVQIRVESTSKKEFTGRVSQIRLNAQMTGNSVRYTVVIDMNEAKGLLPYQTAAVFIDTAKPR
jgi:HlyD family secretion protein